MGRITVGDEGAFAEVVRRYASMIRAVIFNVVHNDPDTDDVLQEVCMELWTRGRGFDATKGKLLGWLITIARRRAIDKGRRRNSYARAQERLHWEAFARPQISRYQPLELEVANADYAQLFQRIFATMPSGQKEVLQFVFYRGWTQREIARKTGIPLGTIKTRIELGIRKMRKALLAMGSEEEWSIAA